jgi:hypothetical protein
MSNTHPSVNGDEIEANAPPKLSEANLTPRQQPVHPIPCD